MVKKVVTTVGRFGDYIDEIQQSYELEFTPYRLHTNSDGTFVTPIRVYDGNVYVLDDETTMQVTTRHIATYTISSKLIYSVRVMMVAVWALPCMEIGDPQERRV